MRLHPATVIVGILCGGAIVFADKQIEPILRDLNIRLSMTVVYIVQYTYIIAACTLLLPIVVDRFITGSGIPLAVSVLAFVVANLFAQMCYSGCLHQMDFDTVTFLTFGYGVIPVLCLLSASLWVRFVVSKLSKTTNNSTENVPNPAV